jgi:hypothetical protein
MRNKMAATIMNMELQKVDILKPSMMMEGDFIDYDGEVVEILSIESDPDQYFWYAEYQNEFGEKDTAKLVDSEYYDWYVHVN